MSLVSSRLSDITLAETPCCRRTFMNAGISHPKAMCGTYPLLIQNLAYPLQDPATSHKRLEELNAFFFARQQKCWQTGN